MHARILYTIILGMKHNLYIYLQVIKNIRNVTRHRNGQSVKSRQTRWEWQLDFVSHVIVYAWFTLSNFTLEK